MANVDADTEMRPSDGKKARSDYEDPIKRRARLLWCLGNNIREIAEQLGVKRDTIHTWNKRAQPDGRDWEEYKESLKIGPKYKPARKKPPGEEWEQRKEWFERAQQLMEKAVEALEGNAVLYDGKPSNPERQEVEYLYNGHGRKIPLQGIRPASMTEVVKAMKAAENIGDRQIQRMKELQKDFQDKEQLFREWWFGMLEVVEAVLGDNARGTLEEYAERLRLLKRKDGAPEIEIVDGEVVEVEDEAEE